MSLNGIAGDGKAEADPASAGIAGLFEPVKRPENIGPLICRNARPVVVDGDLDCIPPHAGADRNMLGIAHGVFDQVGDAAAEPVGADGDVDAAFGMQIDTGIPAPGLIGDIM